jgi:hypothetical protein
MVLAIRWGNYFRTFSRGITTRKLENMEDREMKRSSEVLSREGKYVIGFLLLFGLFFLIPSTWAQGIEDITWTPASPTTATSVIFVVKVFNPGPEAPICVTLETPGGSLAEQTHPGIGFSTKGPINVRFKPVTYAKPGTYQVKAMLMTKECRESLKQAKAPLRVERIVVRAPQVFR